MINLLKNEFKNYFKIKSIQNPFPYKNSQANWFKLEIWRLESIHGWIQGVLICFFFQFRTHFIAFLENFFSIFSQATSPPFNLNIQLIDHFQIYIFPYTFDLFYPKLCIFFVRFGTDLACISLQVIYFTFGA